MAPLIQSWSSLFSRSALPNSQSFSSITSFVKRSALSPLAHELSRRADSTVHYDPGHGAKDPNSFNKILFIVLFACIGSGMVLTSIYFFFIARNGGFVWKENDWDDYKSTVLRRKGPDGKTLSNATKSTKLGGGSVVPKWDDDRYTDVSGSTLSVDPEMGQIKNNRGQARQHYRNNQQDPVFKNYADEKPAGVGGLNKPHEGSHYAPTSTARSEATAPLSKKEKKELDRREKDARKKAAKDQKEKEKEQKKKQNEKRDRSSAQPQPPKPAAQTSAPAPGPRAPASTTSYAYSDNNSYVAPNSAAYGVPQPSPSSAGCHSYYKDYRPQSTLRVVPEDRLSQRSSPSGTHRPSATGGHSRQGSPRKQHRDAPSDHGTSSYNGTNSDVGTKVYPCHIPGVSHGEPAPAPPSTIFQGGRDEVRPDESASQIGVQQAPRRGFRRGRGGI